MWAVRSWSSGETRALADHLFGHGSSPVCRVAALNEWMLRTASTGRSAASRPGPARSNGSGRPSNLGQAMVPIRAAGSIRTAALAARARALSVRLRSR